MLNKSLVAKNFKRKRKKKKADIAYIPNIIISQTAFHDIY